MALKDPGDRFGARLLQDVLRGIGGNGTIEASQKLIHHLKGLPKQRFEESGRVHVLTWGELDGSWSNEIMNTCTRQDS